MFKQGLEKSAQTKKFTEKKNFEKGGNTLKNQKLTSIMDNSLKTPKIITFSSSTKKKLNFAESQRNSQNI